MTTLVEQPRVWSLHRNHTGPYVSPYPPVAYAPQIYQSYTALLNELLPDFQVQEVGFGQMPVRMYPQLTGGFVTYSPYQDASESQSQAQFQHTRQPHRGIQSHLPSHRTFVSPFGVSEMAQPVSPFSPADATTTYPPNLRQVLSQADTFRPRQSNTVYNVVQENRSDYMGDSSEILATFSDLRRANNEAATIFLREFSGVEGVEQAFRRPDGDGAARFSVRKDGGIACEIESEGSMGGLERVYVQVGVLS